MTNGDHAAARARRSVAAAQGSATSRLRLAPLRRIVNREIYNGELIETLECNHTQNPRQPLFGGVGPKSRRCIRCLEAMEAEAKKNEKGRW